MTVQLSVDGKQAERLVADVERPVGFPTASGAPNREHGFELQQYGSWVDVLGSAGKHQLDVDVFVFPDANTTTVPVGQSPFCFNGGKLVAC